MNFQNWSMLDKDTLDKSFWQVAIEISKEKAADFESFMMKSGAIGFHEVLYEEGKTDNLNNDNTIHYYYFPENFPIRAFVPMVLTVFESDDNPYEIEKVSYRDFLKVMEETFQPLEINKNLWILPPWKSHEEVSGKKLIINPAFAFGTGRHATTNLVLNAMEKFDFKNKTVLDMGTGSGVLAIYALMLGAREVTGIDVESLSIESSLENYELNKILYEFAGKANFIRGDFGWVSENPGYKFDIFISNILPDIFYQNKENFLKCLDTASVWILSGIVMEKQDEFLKWLKENNITCSIGSAELDGWLVFFNQ